MKTTGILVIIGSIQGLYRVYIGLYRDNGKENGNYYVGFKVFC